MLVLNGWRGASIEMTPNQIYIRDDDGRAWHFDKNACRIKCVAGELEGTPDNGYECYTLEDGVRVLNMHGYITGLPICSKRTK